MLEFHRHGDIHEIRLARPPVNALTPELLSALRTAVLEAPAAGARAIVLSGGAKVFSAGMDVPHLMGLDPAGLKAGWARRGAPSRPRRCRWWPPSAGTARRAAACWRCAATTASWRAGPSASA